MYKTQKKHSARGNVRGAWSLKQHERGQEGRPEDMWQTGLSEHEQDKPQEAKEAYY